MIDPSPRRVFLCAAELSGDARAAGLVREWRRVSPETAFVGLGGPRMRAEGVDLGGDLTDAGTIGWFDHWGSMPRYLAAERWARSSIRRLRPDAVIVVDAPGIGFPTAKFARSLGIPVVYFITPQTWLWSPGRAVERLRRHADIVVPVFEREAELYRRGGLDVVFAGHPMVDDLHARATPSGSATPPASDWRRTLAVVPGSRRHAIRRLLPAMLAAAALVAERAGLDVTVSLASEPLRAEVEAIVRAQRASVRVAAGELPALLDGSRVAIAASGSNLLEAVAAAVPAVACYRIDELSYAYAEYVMGLRSRLPAFTVPNLIAGEPVVPELIQHDVTAERIARHALQLARDGAPRTAVLDGYARVIERLGVPGVTRRVVEALATRIGARPRPD